MAAVVAVAVVAVAAAVVLRGDGDDDGGGREEAAATGEDDDGAVEAWDERVAPIAEWVAEERELAFEHPVEVRFLSEEEYAEMTSEEASPDDEQEVQEQEDVVAMFRAFGLVAGDVDLASAGADLAGETTLALYSPQEEVVYVRGEEMTPSVRATVAHELTHVLQDQHFDLGRLTPSEGDEEEAVGLRAVSEGDADRIEDEYVDEELTAEEVEELEAQSEEDQASGEAATTEVPPALVAQSSAPYQLGRGFVTYLDEESAAIDEALQEPPSEQELFDPAARDTPRAEPVEVEAPTVPEGAEEVDGGPLGPVTWFLVLSSRGDPAALLDVVDGWGGDAYVAYRQGEQVCVDAVVAGDDAEATDAFRRALDAWAAQHPGGSATVETVGEAVRLRACDPGAEAPSSGEVGPEILQLPLVRTQIEGELIGSYSASAEEARCASRRIIDEVGVEQLTSEEPPSEVADLVQTAAEECRG